MTGTDRGQARRPVAAAAWRARLRRRVLLRRGLRRHQRTGSAFLVALAAAIALAASCRSAPHIRPPQAVPQPAFESRLVPPVIRVGVLTDASRGSLAADSGVTVWSDVGTRSTLPRATFVSADVPGAGGRFRVQAASLASEGAARGGRLRLLETGEVFGQANVVAAKDGEGLTLDGQPYRGFFEVRGGADGRVTVVNVLNLDDYLRGVVPNELSPQVYPQIEALKAQAVAARTYALRNRGQFQEKGYDICATPACQVYKGQSSEDPLSDQAVLQTHGLAASFHGSWINALYTSTCGGHTEDGANIFVGEPVPYLRGVICAPERSSWGSVKTTASRVPLGEELGLNRDAALLASLGVLEARQHTAAALKGIASEVEVRTWLTRLSVALHRQPCLTEVEPPLARRGGFFHALVASLCWEDRARQLLGPDDPDYLLPVEDRARFAAGGERLAAALLVQEGILVPFPDNSLRPDILITRGQAVGVLARAALRAGPPGLLSAEFRAASAGRLTVRRGEAEESYAVDPGARLFRSLDGALAAASELELAPGDKLGLVVADGRITFLQAEQPRQGPSSDRTSRYFRWEMRLTPDEVARAIARYGSVGTVSDVVPRRLGTSGRVVDLAVKGSTDDLVLTGLKVRWGLGLRENLFVIDRERGAAGQVERFVFTGKGWGHGVGLCQVGASGMALAGASYDDILRHYYTGIEIERAY